MNSKEIENSANKPLQADEIIENKPMAEKYTVEVLKQIEEEYNKQLIERIINTANVIDEYRRKHECDKREIVFDKNGHPLLKVTYDFYI